MPAKTRSEKNDEGGGQIPSGPSSLQEVTAIATEADVRAMRDKVYGKPITDWEWGKCKSFWMADLQWLVNQVRLDETRKCPV